MAKGVNVYQGIMVVAHYITIQYSNLEYITQLVKKYT